MCCHVLTLTLTLALTLTLGYRGRGEWILDPTLSIRDSVSPIIHTHRPSLTKL